MIVRVLVVDDSIFFRRQIKSIINDHPQMALAGEAGHGQEAIEQAAKLKPDVITMDYEMPFMDGVSAVREIMAKTPTSILMFSSLTLKGARITLDALEAGAIDYLPKAYEQVGNKQSQLRNQLIEKILGVYKARNPTTKPHSQQPFEPRSSIVSPSQKPKAPELILLGTSTGGPVALQNILTEIPEDFPSPILLIQHMPAAFTGAFADRLNKQCKITVKEAKNGDLLKPGEAILAPGGQQMMLSNKNTLKVFPSDGRVVYKPSIDITFGSAAKHYRNNALAVVLTGMGSDGREGARMLKKQGNSVWAQESSSCVIDGMPSAVVKAGLADDVVPLDQIANKLSRLF